MPISLFNGGDDSNDGNGGGGDNKPNSPNPHAPQNFGEFNPVTARYQKLPKFGNSYNLDGASNLGPDSSQVTKLPKKLDKTEFKLISEQTDSARHHEIPNDSVSAVTSVTPVTQPETKAVTQSVSQLRPVTNFGNSPVTVDNYAVAKFVIPTPSLEATAEAEANAAQSPAVPHSVAPTPVAPPEIRRGQRVRVHCSGSQRDGLTGVVRESNGGRAIVWLDDANIRSDLRRWECPLNWLEVLRE